MSDVQYPTFAIDLTDYIATNRTGKFIVYRSEDGSPYIPIAETTNATFTDFTALPDQLYCYKYKFILGARDGPLLAEPICLRARIIPSATPTPTCALYQYAYSHQVTHSTLGEITGNYNFDPETGVAENASSDVQIIYNAIAKTWVIASKTAVVSIRHRSDSPRIDYEDIQGVYVSHDEWSNSSDWWKTTNTAQVRNRISYSSRTGTYSVRSSSHQSTDRMSWSLPNDRTYPDTFENIQVNYKDNYFDIRSVRIQDMTTDELAEFINSNAVYYYKKSDTGRFIPRTGWEVSDFWKTSSNVYDQYLKNAVLSIGCFQLTPTPTPTVPPTPLPPTPTLTPSPTNPVETLIYFMTEANIPITTEAGEYFVAE
jgi:hypothetical protein